MNSKVRWGWRVLKDGGNTRENSHPLKCYHSYSYISQKIALMRNLLVLAILLLFSSCQNSDTKTVEDPIQEDPIELIIDIKSIIGSLEETTELLGIPSIEMHSGYPCKPKGCKRATFKNGEIEILYYEGLPKRIIINNTKDYTRDKKALDYLGLPIREPSFINPGTVIRWNNIEGLHEISFFFDYIYVEL